MRPDPAAPGPRKLWVVFPIISVLSKPPPLPYGQNIVFCGGVGWGVVTGAAVWKDACNKSTLNWALVSELGFLDFQIFDYPLFCCDILLKNMLVGYRGINNKGVLDRPWTKWRVFKSISSTLKFQFTVKCWKVDFLMSSKTNSCQSSREKLRMLPDTPRPPQFQLELPKKQFLWKTRFSPGSLTGA